MTDKEAIEILKDLWRYEHSEFSEKEIREALEKGINALEQEPCEDCVSRQKVLEQINCWIGSGEYKYTNATHYLTKRINSLPPVTPQEQKTDVFDKIRAEIEQLPIKTRTNWDGCCPDLDYPEIEYVDVSKDKLLSIIDKYRAESEDKK